MSDHADIGPMTWVFDEDALGQLKEAIAGAHEVVWDTETTGLNAFAEESEEVDKKGHKRSVGARQVLATFTLPQQDRDGEWDGEEPTTWILPLSHPDSPFTGKWRAISLEAMQVIPERDKPLVGHNLKYDVRYAAATTGIDLVEQITWDTADGSRLLESGLSAKLGDASSRAFGVESWKDFDFSRPGVAETLPLFELGEYGARDTYWTWRLKRYQQGQMFLLPGMDEPVGEEEVTNARLGRLATWVAMPTVASLARIELNGFDLDGQMTTELLAESKRIKVEALEKMAHTYEVDNDAGLVDLNPDAASAAPTSLWFRRFTDHAVSRGDMQILELTPTGKPKWSKSNLAKLARQRGEGSVPALVLEQRHHSKRAEFLSAWSSYQTYDGKIHASYNTGMSTGRLSSSGPNMQQVTKSLRPCFVPSEGYVIADFDFSQIELRVAAFISRCEPMLTAFREGADLHRLLAAEVMGKAPEDVTPEERQMAKAVNFGLLFGLGAFGLQSYAEDAYQVTMSRDQATEFYRAYFRKWEGLKDWHARVEARLIRDGSSMSPLGRVRNFRNDGGKHALNAAINAPVQGMASDLMQIAIADIQGLLPAGQGRGQVQGARVVGTVHDSAVVELPSENWHDVALQVQERMENLNPLIKRLGVQLDLPIKIEATVGTRWSLSDVGEIG